jgi:hypothetical protein
VIAAIEAIAAAETSLRMSEIRGVLVLDVLSSTHYFKMWSGII